MSEPLVLLVSALGTLGGALANYYIAYFFGRLLFIDKGKCFFSQSIEIKQNRTVFCRAWSNIGFYWKVFAGG